MATIELLLFRKSMKRSDVESCWSWFKRKNKNKKAKQKQ